MEDIWKDLTALSPHPHPATAAPTWESHQDQFGSLPQPTDDHRKIKISNLPTQTPFPLDSATKRSKPKSSEHDAVDHKRKRLLKNRESAVRSRARRQAYTYHLEAKISLLKEENAELKQQQQQLLQKKKEQQEEKNGKLQRTLTAPF